jgi:hypothetical protein
MNKENKQQTTVKNKQAKSSSQKCINDDCYSKTDSSGFINCPFMDDLEKKHDVLNDVARAKKAHDFWQDTAIKQLSAANNWLLITSTGFLSFCIQKFEVVDLRFAWGSDIDWHLTCYVLSLVISLIAILAGSLALLTRLWDFRITRNIALTKYRFYVKVSNDQEKAKHKKFPIFESDEQCSNYLLSREDAYILVHENELNETSKCNTEPSGRYISTLTKLAILRKTSDNLGKITWRLLIAQIGYLILSVILYIIRILSLGIIEILVIVIGLFTVLVWLIIEGGIAKKLKKQK